MVCCFYFCVSQDLFFGFLLTALLIHWFFRSISSMLISTYLWNFPLSSCYWFVFYSIMIGKDGMISVLYLLRLVLCPNIWSILENVLWILEGNVCSAIVGWNVCYMSGRARYSKVLSKSIVFLLIFSVIYPLPKVGYWSPFL